MYLTRMRLNTARRGARKLLGSPQAMHAAVMHGFPGEAVPAPEGGRTLWRLDLTTRHDAVLYVLSAEEPDLTHLVEQAGWPTRSDGWEVRSCDALLKRLEAGQRWAFRLTANPTRSGRNRKKDESPTQPFGHVTAAQQTDWLMRKAKRCGFTIPYGESGMPNLKLWRREQRKFHRAGNEKPVTLQFTTYDGLLEIDDSEALRKALVAGIGRAKAYGCGLMTLAPAG